MFFKKKYSVIEFGTSKIAIAVGQSNANRSEILGIGMCEYAGFRDNEWVAPQDLSESIFLAKKDAELQTGKKVSNVFVIIPGEFTRTFFSHLSAIPINMDSRIVDSDIDIMIEDGKKDLPWSDGYEIIHTDPVLYLLDGMSWRKNPTG